LERIGLHERIARILRERGLKKTDFAKALGVSRNYISLLANGRKRNVSVTLAKLIETTYGYRADWVLTGEEPAKRDDSLRRLQEDAIEKISLMDAGELRAVAAYIRTLDETDADTGAAKTARPEPVAGKAEEETRTLTEAERKVCELYLRGYRAKDAAEALGLSLNTVKTHSRRIYKKLGVKSRKELMTADEKRPRA
jgi:DNA-binding CsgD family transcriptional regulator/transcriptional regulator with XRE-family HTH domain